MKKWLCDDCGYIVEADNMPSACQRCKTTKFILQEDDKNMANVSLFSREVHGIMKFDSLLNQILDTCDKAAQTNTCAKCTEIFNKAKTDLTAIKQLARAELKSHISKGNWG